MPHTSGFLMPRMEPVSVACTDGLMIPHKNFNLSQTIALTVNKKKKK